MFAKLPTVLAVGSLAVLAAATPNGKRWDSPPSTTTVTVTAPASTPSSASSCSTGPIQCCNQVQSASDPATSILLGLLGIVLDGVDALVGLNCSPITVIGVGSGGNCNANAVCCQNNNVGGLISIGCVPVIL
ncbi:fungal hydrophobin-domain-containing protein [Trametes elegans]|nr:fungal hydrophobin-domain-containing protein [Trametes elegans]